MSNITVTATIFRKLILVLQLFTNNFCAKFGKNPTFVLVPDTRSQIRFVISTEGFLLLLSKDRLKSERNGD